MDKLLRKEIIKYIKINLKKREKTVIFRQNFAKKQENNGKKSKNARIFKIPHFLWQFLCIKTGLVHICNHNHCCCHTHSRCSSPSSSCFERVLKAKGAKSWSWCSGQCHLKM